MARIWNPGTLLGVSSGYWAGCTLQSAVRLQVFTGLAAGSASAPVLAERLGYDAKALELLLDALAALGLVKKCVDIYCNTKEAGELLVVDSPKYMGHIILHHHHLLDGWAQLDRAITTGVPEKKRSYGDEKERESFLMGMFNLAMANAPQVAREVSLGGARRLLDIGGGPGTYGVQFCLVNPKLRAVIFDRPTTEPFARRIADDFGVSDRVDFLGGDFHSDDFGDGPYDVVWISHILHSNTPEECVRILKKVADAMEPSSLVLVHDFILDDTKDGPEFPALFSLNMLLAGNGGRSYSEREIVEMMEEAGIEDVTRYNFRGANESSILAGRTQR